MRKINKIVNIALMFILIGAFLSQNFAYALRSPLIFDKVEIDSRGEKTTRTIYREENVKLVQQVLDETLESVDPEFRRIYNLCPVKKGTIYKIARAVEIGEIDKNELKTFFLKAMLQTMEEFERHREPRNEAERKAIREAVEILRESYLKHDRPFEDFSEGVLFYTPYAEELPIPFRSRFLPFIMISDNRSEEIMRKNIIHEGVHDTAEGFPILWLDEGMTEYLTIMAHLEDTGTKPVLIEPSEIGYQLLSEYTKYGLASVVLFNQVARAKPGEIIDLYFPQLSLVEYLLNDILPSYGITPETFIKAYINGDWPFVIKLFGEGGIKSFELLDKGYTSGTASPGAWLAFLIFGESILEAIKENRLLSGVSSEEVAMHELIRESL